MQVKREERGAGLYYNYGDYDFENWNCDRFRMESVMVESSGDNQSPDMASSFKIFPVSPCSSSGVGVGYIEHTVSKMDTLAGVAIKYGVEVADIKRMNGLVTDLQMFALRTIQIPLPGRHPPSPCLLNGLESPQQNPADSVHRDLFETFQTLKLKSSPQRPISPAMSTLQGYYRLRPEDQGRAPQGFEMAVPGKESDHSLADFEDGSFSKPSSAYKQPLSGVRKSRSLADGLMGENGETADDMIILESKEGGYGLNEKLVRRRQKSEADFAYIPEMLLKEDNSGSRGGGGCSFSAITGKGLALRTNAVNRTSTDADLSSVKPIPVGMADSIVTDSLSGVRKSSSTSNLQDQDNSSFPSIWPTSMWNLKPDLQALSTAAITRPIFDGLPKPITGRKNKAALD